MTNFSIGNMVYITKVRTTHRGKTRNIVREKGTIIGVGTNLYQVRLESGKVCTATKEELEKVL